MEREFEIVKLNDGREVKVVELTGLDEMIAAKVVGKEMNQPGAGGLQLRYILLAFAVKEVDGKEIQRPVKLNDVRGFLAGFTSRQLSQIGKAYSRLNDYIEKKEEASDEGEVSAAELMD
ncbi:hypothetical protein [Desulfosporosinus sp. FKA]|uniref:hypothetical protein n=1 Tax=Desulfosporosinus sp. FKA TaxID=1969834 RepID=UPI000B498B36|nr:hypothetical protein [Desulfosporosinus sp. FKA]